ncbi:MAG TPA: helix-turn-helix domain-containing protein [Actinomycetes bacterium]|nr:helix-turn-helix domain-containing protein [Actinomycetes bacterium]
MDPSDVDQQLTGLAGLGDPIRRALYRYVADRGVPVSRDEAAHAAGISRPLAAYHLDRLVDDGLLEPRYHRRGGRRGPGAGRPAKHYVRAHRQLELSLPARDYAGLAELLAGAVEADRSGAAKAALNRAAAALGAELGTEAARPTAPDGDPDRVLGAVRQALATRGYEPYDDDGTIRLRNCPFDRIAAQHRQLVCGANHAMLQALTDQVDGDPPTVRAVLDPQPGRCCVTLTRAS